MLLEVYYQQHFYLVSFTAFRLKLFFLNCALKRVVLLCKISINRIILEYNVLRSDKIHKQHLLHSSTLWSRVQTWSGMFSFSRMYVAEEAALTACTQVFPLAGKKASVITLSALNCHTVFQKQMFIRYRFEIFICTKICIQGFWYW